MLSLAISMGKRSEILAALRARALCANALKRWIFMKKLAPRLINGPIINNAPDIQMY
jgi:hypothetical protein